MKFKMTQLWKAAFEETRTDANSDEQARLAACYEAMRQRASVLVAKIAADLPFMTVHDVTHLDALWEMSSIACGNSIELNPAEAFVFGGAVLLHDAAMSLAAFAGGIAELKQQVEWRDLYARFSAALSVDDAVAIQEAENRATEEALRLLHAKQAENLPKISWLGPQNQAMFIIEDQQIRNFYGPKIGKIAHSHWWSIARVEEELVGTLGALPGVTSCTVDLLKVACLLRVADAMHLDQRRSPAFDFALTQPRGISANHWRFQERMAKPFVQGDALVYTAQPPFEANISEAWWTAFDALQMVDRELRSVDRLLRDRQRTPLAVRRVDGAHSPSDLARTVETVGWMPVDSTVRVTDVPKIVATLGGSKLYGDSAAAPIRELIQNGLDSITARRRLQSRPPKWGELQVILEKRDDGFWLCVEDNGVGMSTTVLTGPLIDFGNSFWRSPLAIEEFPGLTSAGMKARGKYGIGFFSVFMLGDHVRVITRRYDRDVRSARVLEFLHGLGSRPNLREAIIDEAPLDGGARIEVKLRINPTEPEGLLYCKSHPKAGIDKLDRVVAAIAPATDVAIKVIHDSKRVGSTGAADWLEIDGAALLGRLSGEDSPGKGKPWLELAELRDEDGRIYGRARVDPGTWPSNGLITVDGLAATRVGLIAGVLIGIETTASRNTALPIVPAPVLAAWASEQALAFEKADVPDREKARAAEIVLAFGGDIAGLPLILWQGRWMSAAEFTETVKDLNSVLVHQGEISHDDDDTVTKREFEASFEVRGIIAQTTGSNYSSVRKTNWVMAITKGSGTTPHEAIEQLLESAWRDASNEGIVMVEVEEDTIVVGEVNGAEIYRDVFIYSRTFNDEMPET
ncbi:ATP-binding protein [Methylosinus sp. H3A]|uniref:HD domain-containing protein n=1 Tax=Methylosinus sp. H3A TaxID=2785786 RepID=UPI0018C3150D|nr:ATP-binding protein [Methylosinus sp. H3A]MBG0809930.1 ATP-binding protein [Methylosinus sp. H3A]